MQTDTAATAPVDYSFMDDPVFIKRFDAAVAVEQEAFDAWVAEDRFAELIASAKAAALTAYKDAEGLPDFDDEKSAWVSIDLGHHRARPLVQALYGENIGDAEIGEWIWLFSPGDVLPKRRRGHYGTMRQNYAALEAFALALSKPGFELRIWRE